MFQPQPTPFAPSCFASYGLAPDLDFAYTVPAGGEGADCASTAGLLYGPQPPQPQPLSQAQPQPPQLPHPHPHQQVCQQSFPSPSSTSASSPYATSTANTSPPPSSSIADNRQHQTQKLQQHQHQQHQLQLQHHNQHQQQQRQQQQQQQQQHHNHSQNQGHPHHHLAPHPAQTFAPLVVPKMEDPGQHDMAAQQAAAKDYQPIREGPLVGNKTTSDSITQEYAKADPVYVEKTAALPRTYSHFRPIQGDGNCGWRAIGFSYFEKLIESGEQAKVEGEVARLTSMNQMLGSVGGYTYYEDWVEEMCGLLREVAQNMGNPALAHMLIVERWNDPAVGGSLIYYLRLLAATFLKANAGTYEPFVQEGGIDGYCAQSIELVDHEIENLGIIALVEVLLKPAGLVLEIAYLDRSPGEQVNQYRFPEEANTQDPASLGPLIYLLYRPDHYDILYRAPPMPLPAPPAAPVSMQVNRVGFAPSTNITNNQTSLDHFSNVNFSTLALIPGLSAPMGGMAPLAPPPPTTSAVEPFSPVQQNPWLPQFPDGLQASTPQPTPQPPAIMASPQPPTPPTPMSASSAMATTTSMVATSGLGPQTSLMPPLRTSQGYHIRFSPVQLEYEETKNNLPESSFQVTTSTFKNSVWNRAHYGNPDFHPEEWSPDDEHLDGRVGSRRKLKKEAL